MPLLSTPLARRRAAARPGPTASLLLLPPPLLLLLLAAPWRAAAHVFWASPPSRADCFYDAPFGVESDTPFRGNPCGRAPRGVRGVLLVGAPACLTARMVVAHPSAFRVSLAPGTAPASASASASAAAAAPFEAPGALLGAFACADLPGGCARSQGSRGDYDLPVLVPANATPGVYSLQLRQEAPDQGHAYYYYDCADVLLVASLADAPAELASAAAAMARSCERAFTKVAYPSVISGQSATMFGTVGAVALLLLCGDAAWVASRHGAMRRAAAGGGDATTAQPDDAEGGGGAKAVDDAAAPPAPYTLSFAAAARAAARRHWRVLTAQAALVVVAYAILAAVNVTWRQCTFRPSPVFGP
jgi:hypothetical protein